MEKPGGFLAEFPQSLVLALDMSERLALRAGRRLGFLVEDKMLEIFVRLESLEKYEKHAPGLLLSRNRVCAGCRSFETADDLKYEGVFFAQRLEDAHGGPLFRGSRIENTLPVPGRDSTVREPFMAFSASRQKARPRPVPLILLNSSGFIPDPAS